MKRTSEDIITARNPGEILAIDLNNIAIDTRGSSSSISTLAGLTQQRRQVGNSGRSGGGDIGRVVRSWKLLCTKVVEIINNLEQECMGSVSLLINQHVLLFDSDEKNFNFSQTALKLKGLCEEAVQKFGNLEGKSSTWGRNMYLLKDTLRVKKLQSGDVGYMKVADMHNTKHTITMLVDKFLHLQGEMEKARNERIEVQRYITRLLLLVKVLRRKRRLI